MTYIFKCTDCGRTVLFEQERPQQSIYGVAYIAGARHEREYAGKVCYASGAKCLVLINVLWEGAQ